MRGRLFIRFFSNSSDQVNWLVMDSNGRVQGGPEISNLRDATRAAEGREVIIFVPGTKCNVTHTNIPTRNRQKLLQAIPYALEDQLAEDIDDLHFAVGPRQSDGYVPVAITSQAQMDQWLDQFQEMGVKPSYVIPDMLSVPRLNGNWSVLLEGDKALVRTGGHTGFSIEPDALKFVLPKMMQSYAPPDAINVVDCGMGFEPQPGIWGEIQPDLHVEQSGEPSLITFIRGFEEQNSFNLLQGKFSRKEQIGRLWRPWKPALIMLGVWFIMSFITLVADNFTMESRYAALKAENIKILKRSFPDVRRVGNNAKRIMQNRLRVLQGGGSVTSSIGFVDLLRLAGPEFKKTEGLKLNRMSFKDGKLDIEMEVKDLQTLDKLSQLLRAKPELEIEQPSASNKGDKVQARLRIKGKAE